MPFWKILRVFVQPGHSRTMVSPPYENNMKIEDMRDLNLPGTFKKTGGPALKYTIGTSSENVRNRFVIAVPSSHGPQHMEDPACPACTMANLRYPEKK